MRFAKIATSTGPTYVSVTGPDDALLASATIPGPVYDPLPAATAFTPGPLSAFTLMVPVIPTKIVCVGRNYRDHAAELGNEVPKEPLIFLKPPSSLLPSNAAIVMPTLSRRVDFEGELAIVIGKTCRNIGPDEDVSQYILGYTLANDVTARDIQKSDGQWTRGKGYDTFCPAGPLVSNEIDPIATPVTVTTHLNGDLRQTGTTADFIFDITHLLRYITSFMTLNPGDLIPTGTPAGVGAMQPGDKVSVHIAGLGALTNHTQAE